MTLRLRPPPHLRPVHFRLLEWLPGDGSWQQEGLFGSNAASCRVRHQALHDLLHLHGMVESRQGRVLGPGRHATEWRLTAEGLALKQRAVAVMRAA